MKKNNTNSLSTGLSILALTVSIGVGLFAYSTSNRLEDLKKNQSIYLSENSYNSSQLKFCINHSIAPCDDDTISTWNDSHDGENFTIKSYETLVEAGIEQYNISR